ncbi:MAG: hypothetical protein WKF52_06440 [Sphingomicrobium sp.]
MSIVKGWKKPLVVLVAITSLTGCDRGSSTYNRINDLPHSEWDIYAATLPVEQRLDLHKEIMERSWHNPLMTISESFNKDPKETYDQLINRLKAGDQSRFYLSVIYSIDESYNFNICDQDDRKVVQSYLRKIATDAVRESDRPDFYRC